MMLPPSSMQPLSTTLPKRSSSSRRLLPLPPRLRMSVISWIFPKRSSPPLPLILAPRPGDIVSWISSLPSLSLPTPPPPPPPPPSRFKTFFDPPPPAVSSSSSSSQSQKGHYFFSLSFLRIFVHEHASKMRKGQKQQASRTLDNVRCPSMINYGVDESRLFLVLSMFPSPRQRLKSIQSKPEMNYRVQISKGAISDEWTACARYLNQLCKEKQVRSVHRHYDITKNKMMHVVISLGA